MKQNLFYGLTPNEVAAAAGICANAVYRYLAGSRKIGFRNALKINAALGIPLWEMRPDIWKRPDAEKRS